MKCDKCGGEATVHEVTIRSGKKVERHLCEQCAKGEGLPVQSQNVSVTQVLSQFIAQQAAGAASPLAGGPPAEAAKATQCPACGTTYAQFRHDGLLGCPECYASFEIQLGPLLERAHEGGTHHVGKVPRRVGGHALPAGRPHRIDAPALPPPLKPPTTPIAPPQPRPAPDDRAKRAEGLRKRLAEAVAAEQYEVAAKLRDELRHLDPPMTPPPPPAPAKKPGPAKPGGGAGSGGGGKSGGGGGA